MAGGRADAFYDLKCTDRATHHRVSPWSPCLSPFPTLPQTHAWLRAVGRAPAGPPSASGELISVISRSCNLSKLLHGQLIIIAIPISGAIRRTARRDVPVLARGNHRLTPAREEGLAVPMPLLAADGISGVARFFQFRATRLASDSLERAQLDSCCCVTPSCISYDIVGNKFVQIGLDR